MEKYQNNFQTKTGRAISGATGRVYLAGTLTLASLFEDDETTPRPNPLTTDSNGEFYFKAADGEYEIEFPAGAGYEGKIVTGIILEDLSDGFASLASTDSGKGAALVGFIQSGSGASSRTMQAKARDTVSLADFGTATGTDDTTTVSNALASGATEVLVTPGTWKIGDVDLPAGVTLRGAGGKISFILGSTASGIDCAAKSSVVGVTFNVGGTDSLGTSAAIDIEAQNVTVRDCHFEGETGAGPSNFKLNYTVRFSNTADCSEAKILNNRFKNIYFGVVRQLGNPGTANHALITGNHFEGIDKGDAIEMNIGNDVGVVIANNTFSDISGDSVGDGIAIGIAGDDSLSGPEGDETRRFVVTGNTINTTERGIHVEGCNNFLINANVLSGVTGDSTECAIQVYGSSEFTVADNHGFANTIGTIGVGNESTDEPVTFNIVGNTSIDSAKGVIANTDGANTVASIVGNLVVNASSAGIQCVGTADFHLKSNTTQGCTLAYSVDMSGASNRLEMYGNSDTNATTKLTLSNASSATVVAKGNGNIIADQEPETTIVADATTFDARNNNYFVTSANSGATAITAITGRKGQRIRIRGGSSTNATTIADSGNFRLSAALTLNVHTIVCLFNIDGTTWIEESRSVN